MTVITFRLAEGTSRETDASDGQSVMQAAKVAGIDGITAECGGDMVCATCHVFVVSAPAPLPPPSAIEGEMLNFTAEPRRENSRLSCQIKVSTELSGLVLEIPRTQV